MHPRFVKKARGVLEAKRQQVLQSLDLAIYGLERITVAATKLTQTADTIRRLRGELEAVDLDSEGGHIYDAVNQSMEEIKVSLAELTNQLASALSE